MTDEITRSGQGSQEGRAPFFSEGEGDPGLSYGGVDLEPGAQIGPYKLLSVLGEGGYGIVYLAQQEKPIQRQVALKVVKPGMDSKQVVARFEVEKQALALLDHPNLAHVFDAGTTEAGRPYFAMEYIEGVPITEYCDRAKLDVRQRLRLFSQVCQGIQHAHQKGIIHRDLKPSNILVTATDGEPLVKVIDFGIAKALAQPLTEMTLHTQQGQFIGTPDYMSPEQAQMDAQAVDTRSDVYALGVILYELLTGVLPFDPEELRSGGLTHIQTIIRSQEPRTPSTRLTNLGGDAGELAKRRNTTPQALAHSLRRELEWIPVKAMRKETSRRYQSVSDLARDIQNYLEGSPLIAGPESTIYRMGKLVRRHKVLVATSLIIILVVFSATAVVTQFYLNIKRVAEVQRRTLYYKNTSLVDGMYKNQMLSGASSLLASCPDDLRGWEWDRLQYILDESQYTIRVPFGIVPNGAAACMRDQYVWACCEDEAIRCWDLDTGQEMRKLPYAKGAGRMKICVNPSGSQVAVTDSTGLISIYDTNTGKQIGSWRGQEHHFHHLAYNRDNFRLLSLNYDGIQVWDATNGQLLLEIPRDIDTRGLKAAWSPDGSRIAARQGNHVTVFNAKLGSEIMQFDTHADNYQSGAIQFSPDNELIIVYDTQIWLYDANTGFFRGSLRPNEALSSLDLSSDGKKAVSGSERGLIQVWDLSTLNEITAFRGHVQQVLAVGFSPDGERVFSAGNEAIKVWDSEIGHKYLDLLGHPRVCAIAFSPDSRGFVSGNAYGTLKVWNLMSGSEALTLCGHRGAVSSAAFTPDGRQIVSGSEDSTVRLWNATNGNMLGVLEGHKGAVLFVTVSSDNKWIASAGADHMIKLWDMSTGEETRTLQGHQDSVTCLAFNVDSSRIASGGLDHTIRIWDVATGRTLATWSDEDLLRANSISLGQNGTLLLAGTTNQYPDHSFEVYSSGRMARFWDFVKGHESLNLIWHRHVGSFSPDGRRFAHRKDLSVEVRDALTGDLALTLEPDCAWAGAAVFSPDGRTLAVSGRYGGGTRIFESVPPPEGYQIRKSALHARMLVDGLRNELDSYTSVIKRIQDDNYLNDSIRHFALQISRSRLSEERGSP